jgi:hypothetical protein
MELDLQVYLGSICTTVFISWDPAPTHPTFGLIYEGAIGQPRQTTSLCDPLVVPDEVPDKGEMSLGISAHWFHPVQADQGSNLEPIMSINSIVLCSNRSIIFVCSILLMTFPFNCSLYLLYSIVVKAPFVLQPLIPQKSKLIFFLNQFVVLRSYEVDYSVRFCFDNARSNKFSSLCINSANFWISSVISFFPAKI